MVRKVTIICGPPCSGKSTWVQERAGPDDVVVDFDRIARRLGSRSRHDHTSDVKAKVNAEIDRILDDIAAADDVTAWVIRTLPDGEERAALANRLDADVVVIRPPLREIARRAEEDKRPPWTVQAARKWWERFTPHPDDLTAEEADQSNPTGPTGHRSNPTGEPPMPDEPTSDMDEGPEPDPEPRSTTKASSPDKDWAAEAEKWKALARKHEKAAQDLRPLADKAKELEDASKTDLERASAEAQQHLARADRAEGELMRLRVALRKGLTETQAKRLVGTTEDELEADADDLMASFRPADAAKQDSKGDELAEESEPTRPDNQRRRPQERLRPGAVPEADTEPEETDPRKLAALVPRKVFGL